MAQSEMRYQDSAEPSGNAGNGAREPMFVEEKSAARQPIPRHWSVRQIAIGSMLWGVGAVLLAALSFAAHFYADFPGDVGLAVWIQKLHQPILVHVVNFASDANWPYPAGIIALCVIALLLLLRQVRAALCAALAGFGADLLNVTLNGLVARPRPSDVQIHAVAHLGLPSFPSGHVTHVIAFYGFLLYFTRDFGRAHPAWRRWLLPIQIICGYFILFIGPSRVLEGEHWPSDVLGGYLLGGLVLVAGVALYHALGVVWQRFRGRQRQTDSVPPPLLAEQETGDKSRA
jgi:membrane-associated phospholipid phosphatase